MSGHSPHSKRIKRKGGWKDGKALATKRKISLPSIIIKPRQVMVTDMVFRIQRPALPFGFFYILKKYSENLKERNHMEDIGEDGRQYNFSKCFKEQFMFIDEIWYLCFYREFFWSQFNL